jgi:tetratricopeptide (TPR) repeat protein
LSPTASDREIFVDDVVQVLTSLDSDEIQGEALLQEQMQRAADEFDERTAQTFGKALLDQLCQDPSDLRKLEALMILGLAHPAVLEENRIPLAVEGRRLAVLLERAGDPERARCLLEVLATRMPDEEGVDRELSEMLRRSGSTAELIERYLARAEEAVQGGKPMAAIPWLQQVLLLDRTRRDVARMIRDLRYQESERVTAHKRRNALIVLVATILVVVIGVAIREMRIENTYRDLPEVSEGDLPGLRTRLSSVNDLVDQHRFWIGMFRTVSERRQLESTIDMLEDREQEAEIERGREQQHRLALAEAARERGLQAAERGDFDAALGDLRSALELSNETWPPRARVMADIEAIEKWKEESQ